MVCVSVCLCIGHTVVLCKNGLTDHDVIWGWLVGPSNYVFERVKIPHGNGQFWGLFGPSKSIGNLLQCIAANEVIQSSVTQAAKGIIQSSIKAWQRDCCSWLQYSRLVGVTLRWPTWKFHPPVIWPFVKILWSLAIIITRHEVNV